MYTARASRHFRDGRRRRRRTGRRRRLLLLLLPPPLLLLLLLWLLLGTSRVPQLPHMPRAPLRHNYIVLDCGCDTERIRIRGPAKGHLRGRTRTDIILSSLCSPPPTTATAAAHSTHPRPPYPAPICHLSHIHSPSPFLLRAGHSILSIPQPRDATRNAPRHP